MPFFKTLVAPPRSTEAPRTYTPPLWTGPSEHCLGGLVPIRARIAQGDGVRIALDGIRAYHNGFVLSFVIATERPVNEVIGTAWPPWRPGLRSNPLRVGFEFANGRCAGDDYYDVASAPKDPSGLPFVPIILLNGAVTGSHRFFLEAWCWPLPPDGPMAVYVEWEDRRVRETHLLVDGERIRGAALEELDIWAAD